MTDEERAEKVASLLAPLDEDSPNFSLANAQDDFVRLIDALPRAKRINFIGEINELGIVLARCREVLEA